MGDLRLKAGKRLPQHHVHRKPDGAIVAHCLTEAQSQLRQLQLLQQAWAVVLRISSGINGLLWDSTVP